MHLTPRELDKLLIYLLAEVARRRREQGLKLNHPRIQLEAVFDDGSRLSPSTR